MTSRIVRTQTEAGNGTSSPVPPLRSNSGSGAVGCGRDGICGGCTGALLPMAQTYTPLRGRASA